MTETNPRRLHDLRPLQDGAVSAIDPAKASSPLRARLIVSEEQMVQAVQRCSALRKAASDLEAGKGC